MQKKILYWSLLSIPIILIIFLITLYFTNIWQPTLTSTIICLVLLCFVGIFVYYLITKSYRCYGQAEKNVGEFDNNIKQRIWKLGIIGFIADFFDTIGIGSFAISIVLLKLTKQIKNDKKILGTLNIGHAVPTCLEAIIFISLIKVEWLTLVFLIAAASIGSYLGAMFANKIKLGWAQIFISIVLIIISIIILLGQKQVGVMPSSGNADSLQIWWKYLVGAVVFFILGALMSLGVGIYAPAMAVTYLLGLSAICAFPIMMGSAAFLMPIGALRFIKDQNYEIKPSLAFTIGGSFGVICAYLIVFIGIQKGLGLNKDNFVNILTWLIIVVIWYTAGMMIYEYVKNKKQASKQEQT
ncbi:hypothetical protein P344_00760 [Spiroplasma mirum ATCC 29335]|uniref:Probable membrane transporter protein n=1 Tax=Spiroplasma mirum ATCC 29335 TaxID=838561 RepID=W0GPZ1_9MOLU|nr:MULTISPECIES: TSUP family transporter [Spiroplasma]AHF60591.1 hypothetical protein SMM_0124 [Spiroplasma mirum ATCC 29335]AHI57525.1 hypothetical protein P344_00760 [Spiroplasma mirum ATCC 29335]AKM52709.1 permease [Spiroplasma atrichopogonis]